MILNNFLLKNTTTQNDFLSIFVYLIIFCFYAARKTKDLDKTIEITDKVNDRIFTL